MLNSTVWTLAPHEKCHAKNYNNIQLYITRQCNRWETFKKELNSKKMQHIYYSTVHVEGKSYIIYIYKYYKYIDHTQENCKMLFKKSYC